MWKHLHHQNIVPLLGVTSPPLQLISEGMSDRELTEHIKKYPDTDRLCLVGVPRILFDPSFTPGTSYLVSLKAFNFSTFETSFMVTSRVYVILLNPVLPAYQCVSSQISLWMMPVVHGSLISVRLWSPNIRILYRLPQMIRVILRDGLHRKSLPRRGHIAKKLMFSHSQ